MHVYMHVSTCVFIFHSSCQSYFTTLNLLICLYMWDPFTIPAEGRIRRLTSMSLLSRYKKWHIYIYIAVDSDIILLMPHFYYLKHLLNICWDFNKITPKWILRVPKKYIHFPCFLPGVEPAWLPEWARMLILAVSRCSCHTWWAEARLRLCLASNLTYKSWLMRNLKIPAHD